MKRPFSIQPSTNMMEVLGFSGYTFDTAVADIIDNSISAGAQNITIFFDVKTERPYMYILDDGRGMDSEELKKCVIPAFRDLNEDRDPDDLGRYSLGLKSAAKSLCSKLYVCSRKTADCTAETVELDFDYIRDSKKWEAFETDNFSYSDRIGGKGTLVFLENLKIQNRDSLQDSSLYQMFEKLENSLSHIFARYIIEDGLNIWMQSAGSCKKSRVEGWNPFELPEDKSTSVIADKKISLKKADGKTGTVSVRAYIMPTFTNLSAADQKYMMGKGLIEQQGFYIYRNKRLIQEGGWLDLDGIKSDGKCQSARIAVDIGTELDKEFGVNFSKNKIIVPAAITEDLLSVAKLARKYSKQNYNYIRNPEVRRKAIKEKEITVWKTFRTAEGLKLTINTEHPVIKRILSQLTPRTGNQLTGLLERTIPIGFIQSAGDIEQKFDHETLSELMTGTYIELKQKGLSVDEIKKEMFRTEPFTFYLDELLDFFSHAEEGKNNDEA